MMSMSLVNELIYHRRVKGTPSRPTETINTTSPIGDL